MFARVTTAQAGAGSSGTWHEGISATGLMAQHLETYEVTVQA